MAIRKVLGKIVWQDLLIVLLTAYYLVLHGNITSGLRQLPSPIYGGDYYYQLGSVNHMLFGGDPLKSSNTLEGVPIYLPLYGFLVAKFAAVSGMDAISAMLYFSLVVLVASLALAYIFFNMLFRDRLLAILGTMWYLPIGLFPVVKYTDFSHHVVVPLFLISALYFFREGSLRSSVLLGVVYGLSGLSHSVLFIKNTMTLFVLAFYFHVWQNISFREGGLAVSLKKALSELKRVAPALAIGLGIAMLYWYEPVFVYHGKTINSMNVWTQPDFTKFGVQLSFLYRNVKGLFLNFSDLQSLLRLAGIGLFFAIRKHSYETRFLWVLVISAFVEGLHYFVTIPLLGMQFVPDYIFHFNGIVFTALALFVAKVLLQLKPIARYSKWLLLVAVLYFAYAAYPAAEERVNETWMQVGQREMPPNLASMQEWVVANTGVNDVFLSTNELDFVVNALTGRKVLNGRRSHNSAFIDMDGRYADAAVILYGNSTKLRVELLKKYRVKYLYWDYYWIQSEYYFDKDGRMAGTFDPLLVFDSQEYRDYFERNNVTYFKMNTWVDPAMKSEDIPKYDLLFIIPNQWNWEHPWSAGLDPYLKEVWKYEQGGQVMSRIYEVRV